MGLCVRKIDYKRLWDAPEKDETWLTVSDLRADALRDLPTENNRLSIYEIDGQNGVPLPRVLAALAARRQYLAKLDFIVFDSKVLDELKIDMDKAAGITYDAAVNGCHFDLIKLTAQKLAQFGARIRETGNIDRYSDKKVKGLINDAVRQQFMDAKQFSPELAKKL